MIKSAVQQPDKSPTAVDELRFTLRSFEGDGFSERQLSVDELASLDASVEASAHASVDLAANDQVRWLEVRGKLDEAVVQMLSSALQLHPLTQEHLAADSHRPTVAVYDDYVFITMRYLLQRRRPPIT